MKIEIEYCQRWNYEPDALRARDRLAASGRIAAGDIALRPGRTGSFEITRDGKTVFSKLERGRFPEDAELDGMVWNARESKTLSVVAPAPEPGSRPREKH